MSHPGSRPSSTHRRNACRRRPGRGAASDRRRVLLPVVRRERRAMGPRLRAVGARSARAAAARGVRQQRSGGDRAALRVGAVVRRRRLLLQLGRPRLVRRRGHPQRPPAVAGARADADLDPVRVAAASSRRREQPHPDRRRGDRDDGLRLRLPRTDLSHAAGVLPDRRAAGGRHLRVAHLPRQGGAGDPGDPHASRSGVRVRSVSHRRRGRLGSRAEPRADPAVRRDHRLHAVQPQSAAGLAGRHRLRRRDGGADAPVPRGRGVARRRLHPDGAAGIRRPRRAARGRAPRASARTRPGRAAGLDVRELARARRHARRSVARSADGHVVERVERGQPDRADRARAADGGADPGRRRAIRSTRTASRCSTGFARSSSAGSSRRGRRAAACSSRSRTCARAGPTRARALPPAPRARARRRTEARPARARPSRGSRSGA